jgi:PAS domain S-box-containing protein
MTGDASPSNIGPGQSVHQTVLLEALAETVPDGVLIVSLDGKILHFNQHFLKTWHFPSAIIERRSDEEALQWAAQQTADPDRFLTRVAEVYAFESGPVCEELLMKDGRVYERFGSPLQLDGIRLGWVWTFRDITRRKQAEAALRESESRKEAILASAQDCLITMDAEGRIIDFNAAAERTFGWRREDVIGRTVADTIIPPHLRDAHWKGMARYLRTGQQEVLGRRVEVTAMRADGSVFPVELSITAVHLSGRPPFFTAYVRDITQRKQAEDERAALLASERRARAEAESLHEVSLLLIGELDLHKLLQAVTDASTRLSGAQFGAFFYNDINEQGESYSLYTLTGAPREAFDKLGPPRNTALFEPTFHGREVVRIADVLKDPRYGQNPPHHGMPSGHLPVRSYLAVPVISRSGNVRGGLFFGHPDPDVFTEHAERLVLAVAAQAAIALDNAWLYREAQREVSRRKEMEEALRARTAEFESLVTGAPLGVAFFDRHHRYVRINEELAAMNGFSATYHVGRPIDEILPAHAAAMKSVIDRIFETGNAIRNWEVTGETPREPGVRRHWLAGFYPVRDEHGAVGLVGAWIVDITDRKRAEEALRASHDTFRHLVDHSPFGLYAVDADFRLVQVSAGAQKVFCNVRPLLGRDFAEVMRIVWAEPFATEAIRLFRHTLDTGEPYHSPSTVEHRQDLGKEESYDWKIERVTLPDGRFGAVCHFYDLSERQRYEAALRDSEERFKALAANLEQRVEVRTVQLLQSEERLRALASELNLAEQRERKRLAAELHDHLQQMLVLGKLKLGQGKRLARANRSSEAVITEVDEVLTEALTYTRTLVAELSPPVLRDHGLPAGLKWLGEYMKKHDMAVTVTVSDEEGLTLPEDQTVLLFQSVRELLMNSWKHAGTGQATVRMERQAGTLRIEVRDEGKGIDHAHAEGSPDRFAKYGLFSIRERMKALGGSFLIESAPGRGTTGILTLPLAEARPVLREPPLVTIRGQTDEGESLPDNGKIRVLLVDDHAMVRQGLRTMLETYPAIEVAGEATNGVEAVALVETLRPSVILMDINMPRMNGIEATTHIKAHYPNTIVIGLSVNAGGQNEVAMAQAGATALITKEAAVDELYAAIQQTITGDLPARGPV